ncbi:hypothetical protein E4T56_gene12504 [Termitomyces sp. T112]|nr:hypothetical protein E4T56_gene12504 [Termitomyces sp. T112]
MDISELPVPIRQRSLSYYLALFCIVVPFCSTIPFAWLYVLYVVGTGTVWYALNISSTSKWLFPVALCEVLFSVYQYYLWRIVSPPAPYGPGDPGEIQAAFKRLLKSGLTPPTNGGDEGAHRPGSPEEDIVQLEFDDPRAIDFRNALRPWFGNATWSSIKLHQVHQWLYWSIYNADMPSYESLTASQQAVMAEIGVVNLLARHFDWTSNTLWFEEIPNACDPTKSFFLLGGQDSIVHSERVKRYLTSHGVKGGLWYDPVGSHGQALKPGTRGHLEILRWIREEI